MAILVTGGAGYIGSVTVERLTAKGESVVVLDDLAYGHRESIDADTPFYQGFAGDRGLLVHIIKEHQIESCVHFAALAVNLGTGRGHSVLEVIETARRITGLAIRARIEGPRPGDPAWLVADPSRAKALLGWEPAMSDLNAILQSAWVWKKKRPRGYRSLATAK